MSETLRDQDHAQTLREMVAMSKYSQERGRSADVQLTNRKTAACEAGAAALERTCATCHHYFARENECWHQPNAQRPTGPDFGCTLHQPQETL